MMKEKTRKKWQEGLSEFIEPDERVEAAARGIATSFWQLVLILAHVFSAALNRFRAYVVTDRHLYVFQASALSKFKVTKMLEKRPLGEARVECRRGYLTVDGAHRSFIALAGPAKRPALAVVEAAVRPPAPAAPILA